MEHLYSLMFIYCNVYLYMNVPRDVYIYIYDYNNYDKIYSVTHNNIILKSS